MHRSTKACEIPMSVKKRVWERDEHRCVICGSTYTAAPVAHYIPRSHLGLGVEKNIVTLCMACHCDYDNSDKRERLGVLIKRYLMSKYLEWDERELVYKKYGDLDDYYNLLSANGKDQVRKYIKRKVDEEKEAEKHRADAALIEQANNTIFYEGENK